VRGDGRRSPTKNFPHAGVSLKERYAEDYVSIQRA